MTSQGAVPTSGSRTGWLVLAGILALAAVAVYAFRQPVSPPKVQGEHPDSPDPRLAYKGQYRNIHPNVKYTGTRSCIDCHLDIAARFAKHPMGRSMAVTSEVPGGQPPFDGVTFDGLGRRFWLSSKGGRTYHHVAAYDGEDKIYEQVREAKLAIGSGTHGFSYLDVIGGHVVQTSISYFAQKPGRKWDISPGFNEGTVHGRPVMGECLQCHVNGLKMQNGDNDRFGPGVFEGHAIGCERCHGPGETHVRERERGDPIEVPHDTATVNPARLSPHLRDSVCEQCHLQGRARVLRAGRGLMDFRPGLPLEEFFNSFIPPDAGAVGKSVGHFEEMHLSKCHQASAGKMGCISCHDPHYKPGPGEKAEFFRERCNRCHEGEGKTACSERAAAREAKGNSCIACHMPTRPAEDVVHAALTDHRVPLRSGDPSRQIAGRPAPERGELLRSFYIGRLRKDSLGMRRDLAIALMRQASAMPPMMAERMAREQWETLEDAVIASPRDHAAWGALAMTRHMLGDPVGMRKAIEHALTLRPDDTRLLSDAAMLLRDDPAEALPHAKRLAELAPHLGAYRRPYVNALIGVKDWPTAAGQARIWVDLAPGNIEARVALCRSLAMAGRTEDARKELATLRKLKPPNLLDLEAMMGSLPRK